MKSILIPSDFSSNAVSALRYAIQLGQRSGADLVVYHCSNIVGLTMPAAAPEVMVETMIAGDEENKQQRLEQQVKETYESLGIAEMPAGTKVVVEFSPLVVESVIEQAKQTGADLIVMGTHGSSGLEKFFFGSNTSSVIAKSPVPVLAIPEKYTGNTFSKFCFCSDLEHIKEELDQLVPLLADLSATLDILYFDYGKDPSHALLRNAEAVIQSPAFRQTKLIVQDAGIEISLVQHIKNYLDANAYDCMIMITHERSFWDRLFISSKTEEMSSSLKIPMLSIKKGKADPVVSY